MATNVVPEQRTVICDRCGKPQENDCYANHGKLSLTFTSRAWDGAGAGGTASFDLCNTCLRALLEFLKRLPEVK